MEQLEHAGSPNEYREAFNRLRTAKIWLWWLVLAALLINLGLGLTVRLTSVLEASPSFRADRDAMVCAPKTRPADSDKSDQPAKEEPKKAEPPAPATQPAAEPPAPPETVSMAAAPADKAEPSGPADGGDASESDEAGSEEAAAGAGSEFLYLAMKPGLAVLRAGGLFCALLMALVLLLALKMCLLGRLGGVAHLTSAMLWSLVLAVLLAPWDLAFPGFPIPGILFGRCELMRMTAGVAWGAAEADWATNLLYWVRFVGYPLLGLILLFTVQVQYARGLGRVWGDLAES